jgi:outer membrane protein OmpA-like peptidoglycan-associated protein
MARKARMLIVVGLLATAVSLAQTETETGVPVYRITVVGRTIKAINYRHRSAPTEIEFRGTSLMPDAKGKATVQARQGVVGVDAEMKHLQNPEQYGSEYLTFVLWAISPEGRPVNLGEVIPDSGGTAKIRATCDLQSFGLIVTAEPYFAVTQPSNVVVMENFVTQQTNGTIEEVDAKYELLERGMYTVSVPPGQAQPITMNGKTPLALYEAENAVRIARWAGADRYASDTLQKAKTDLENAEALSARHKDSKDVVTDAREAVQNAEDARLITVRKIQAEQQAEAQQQSAEAQARAQQEAEQARAAADQKAREQAEAEAARAAALQQQQLAQAQAQQAEQQARQAQERAAQAEHDKTAMRARLLQQLNAILQTRDTNRGLVVTMQDILFETGQYQLKQGARETLAKIAGVLLAYPGIKLEIDGFTDDVGSEERNEELSEKRADSVQDFLIQQGVPADSVTARGLGEANPVATNDTRIGRQLNRRVELVLHGDVIGANTPAPAAGGE